MKHFLEDEYRLVTRPILPVPRTSCNPSEIAIDQSHFGRHSGHAESNGKEFRKMSSIGSGPLGIPPLANSAAGVGGQQKSAEANRANHDGQIQKFQLDRADQYEKTVGDIGESDGTDERDADGRMPWKFKLPGAGKPDGSSSSQTPQPHPPDLAKERGNSLDLDA
jgi:hypothetical protein